MELDWNVISGLAALVTAVFAIIAVLAQIRMTRYAWKLDFLWRMNDRFNSDKMRFIRRAVCSGLVNNEITDDVDDILDFFDGVGLLLEKGTLDIEMVWNDLGYWATGYWYPCLTYIREKQDVDRHFYTRYEELVNRLNRLNAKKYPGEALVPTDEESMNFLLEEASLL